MDELLLGLINTVRGNKGQDRIVALRPDLRLRQDLGFDSFDLAELTVRIEEACQMDIFADGLVHTVGEVLAKLERKAA